MADDRLRAWEKLFSHVLSLLDESVATGAPESGWSFGGGTVLMRRYRHRVSRDVDIFVPDPQWLGYLTPRLNAKAESLAPEYVEHGLHEGNIARYRLRLSEFRSWKAKQAG